MDSDLEPVALTPQKQDSAWKHCEVYKYGDRVQMRCLYCKKMFKGGGITRVKEHLAGKKGQGTICDQVPEEVRLFLQQCIDGTVRRQRKRRRSSAEPLPIAYFPPEETQVVEGSYVNNGEVVAAGGGQSSGRTKQRTYRSRKNIVERSELANVEDLIGGDMDNLIPVAISSVKNIVHPSSKDREKTVHMAIGRFLFDIGADFDAVNSVNFQPLVDAIVSGGFGVSLPANEDIKSWILKSCVEEVKKDIDECRPLWKRTGCSVLVQESNKVLNFLVHCPEKVVFLRSFDASEILTSDAADDDDDDKLCEVLKEVVEEIGDTNVVQVITKCEDHYVSAGKKLMEAYPSLYWVPCAAHCVDKMLEEFGKIDWIREIIEQARTVTRIIYNHSGVLNLMKKFTYGNDILQPAFTTYSTNFATMARIAELKPHLQAMVTSSEWNECSYSKEAGDTIQDIIGKDINSYKNAVGIFGRNLAIRARDTMLPAEWWSTYGESCLNLSRFAIRLLSQTCSSLVGSGRNLTPLKKVYESKNSIERQRLSDLVFVQYNMRLRRLGVESGDDNADPLSQSNMELLEDWVSRNQVCIEGNGSSDWKSLESFKRTEVAAVVIDETEDLGTGFDDGEIFKGEKEVSDEGYFTNISEKLFT
ncbi:hypothetical protein HID58_094545 [Brassica napus]|uniref:BED-type domain-containing protein n=1 Tax=Brassica napus TaxID=3708 RepID=A0ABQ7X9G5_BRANA|nr:hypothetical protein HID58_094545 [Brassica napus]